jgi:hypothetical protein
MSRSNLRTIGLASILALGSMALAGCGPDYDHTDITGVKSSDLGGGVDRGAIAVPEGLIVKAHIVAWNDDKKQMGLTIRSRNPDVVEVAGVVNDHDYAFLGHTIGHTDIEFVADDKVVLTVGADVTPQPEVTH